MKINILVADDEQAIRELMYELLSLDYDISLAENGQQVLDLVQTKDFDLLILDIRMPLKDGIEVLKEIREDNKDIPVIIVTANRDADTAIEAMKLGVFDYVVKPFKNEKLEILIKNALKSRSLEQEVKNLRFEISQKFSFDKVIGVSKEMKSVFHLLERVVDNDSTILINGESGSGKEVIAKAIHFNSHRKNGPFIAVDCGAIPENLIENEFFGHEKGSYTGAISKQKGKFEMANGGSLFLDEISNLHLDLQSKLLRVIQEREFSRIGSTEKQKVDTRIIAATNLNLEEEVNKGTFRKDLFYRLNVIPIRIPPLRERRVDIPILLNYFIDKFNKEMNKNAGFNSSVYDILQNYNWPGNIRELENLVQRLIVMKKEGIVSEEDLPPEINKDMSKQSYNLPIGLTLEDLEKKYISKSLVEHNWNISQTATYLGITRKTLHNKITKFKLK